MFLMSKVPLYLAYPPRWDAPHPCSGSGFGVQGGGFGVQDSGLRVHTHHHLPHLLRWDRLFPCTQDRH